MNYRRLGTRRFIAAALTTTVLGLGAVVAHGDDIVNDLDNTIDNDRETLSLTAGGSTGTVGITTVNRNSDGKNGCNIQSTAPSVTFNVASSDTSVATVSPSTVTFTSCGQIENVTVSPVGQGNADVTFTVATNNTAGSWNPAPANFKVDVGAAAVTNAAPTVSDPADDVSEVEGTTLAASGAFIDDDGDTLTLTADNTAGTFADNGDGTWSWSLPTTDDVAQSTITVTADDGNGGTVTDSFTYEATNGNPALSALSLTSSNCSPTLDFTYSDPGSGDTHTGSIDWGDGSTDDTFTASPVSQGHSYAVAGVYPIQVGVTDDDGGTDSDTINHTVNNIPSGILPPVNSNGTSVFKHGSTVPVKITVTGCSGIVSTISPQVTVVKLANGTESPPNEAIISTSNADTGTQMRYSDGQYIYNLATKSLSTPATYRVKVSHPTFPATVTQDFGIKK